MNKLCCYISVVFIRNQLKEVSRHDLDNLYEVKVSRLNEHQQNAFFTEAARYFQSQQQSSGLGQAAVTEMHEILATTKYTLELVKKINDHLLKLSSTDRHTIPEDMPSQPKKSFESFPRPHHVSFGVIGHYV